MSNNNFNKVCYKCISEFEFPSITDSKQLTPTIDHIEFDPENYAYYESNLGNVKKLVKENKKVCVSIAATYQGWYEGKNFKQISAAIKKLGFHIVEETAIGASQVISEYSNLMELGQSNIIINTFCPSVVTLVEEYFPNLIENLAPISSPMVAHAKLMRDTYGDVKIVYIGSCHSKVDESREELTGLYVNEVMTFADLDSWFEEKNISIDEEDESACGVDMPLSRLYPLSGGLVKALDVVGLHKYTPICVDGLDRCIKLFTKLGNVNPKQKIFIEASVCENGCVDTELFKAHNKSVLNVLIALNGAKQPHDDKVAESGKVKYPHPMLYVEKKTRVSKPTPKIKKAKSLKKDEFICISCGVRSCKEFAISIKDEDNQPFNKGIISSGASVVLENSPNGVVTFNENFVVTSINPMAEYIYEVDAEDVLNTVNTSFAEEKAFSEAKTSGKPYREKCNAREDSMFIERSIVYVPESKIFILFATDISAFNKGRKEYENLRFYADNIAKEITRFLEFEPVRVEPVKVKSKKAETTTTDEVATKTKKSPKVIDAASTSLEKSLGVNKAKAQSQSQDVEPKQAEESTPAPAKSKKSAIEAIKIDSSVDKKLVTIMVGPPFDKYYDTTMVSKLMTSDGVRVVCGKTTSQIVSKITGRSITAISGAEDIKDAPTTSIEGIHLITHGVMTISRVLEHLRAYQKDENHVEKMKLTINEEATILSTFFINECEHINFLIGDSQDPTREAGNDPLASFGLKTNLINDLADLLEEMGKHVDLNFF